MRTAWDSGNLRTSIDDEEPWPFVLLTAQRCAAVLGADAVALQSADALLGEVGRGTDGFGVALAKTALAESLLSLGDLAAARTTLEGIEGCENQFTWLATARLALLSGRFAEASRLAGRLATANDTGAASRVEALFLASAAVWALGQHDSPEPRRRRRIHRVCGGRSSRSRGPSRPSCSRRAGSPRRRRASPTAEKCGAPRI